MWVDPLAGDPRIQAGGVLLDDLIREYVRHGLILDEGSFEEGKLKGASYTMTPSEEDDAAVTFLPALKPGDPDRKVALQRGTDHLGDFYWVPKNSLVYIRLKQKLRLPFYMIGRHNLKIRYVYKGLLLGTGPQVDPGFEGNLFIPLHNFTTSDVKVHLNKSFVSIDFVRTTRFVDPSNITATTITGLRRELEDSDRVLIEEDKVTKRKTLEHYLEGTTPRSQMAKFEFEFNNLSTTLRKDLGRAKLWMSIERVGVVLVVGGLLVTTLNYFRGFVADLQSQMRDAKALATTPIVKSMGERIDAIDTNFEARLAEFRNQAAASDSNARSSLADLQRQLAELQRLVGKQAGAGPGTNSAGTNTVK